jgi:predicted DNA-binding transcriptional regulator AlpA
MPAVGFMVPLIAQKEAARLLRLSVRTLERHRVAGTGPRWVRLGRLVRYRQSDLTDWVETNLRFSTSQVVAPRKPTATEPKGSDTGPYRCE